MKRVLETDDKSTTVEVGNATMEVKKIRFPFVVTETYEPLPSKLEAHVKENPGLYLSVDSESKWDWNLEEDMNHLGYVFSSNENEDMDLLIDRDQKDPMPFSPSLLALYRDILRTQQKLAETYVESVTNGEFQDNSTKLTLERLDQEQLDKDMKIHISPKQMTSGLRKIDYSVPFILHLGACFKDFATSKGHSLPAKLVDVPEYPVTLKMIKENPEGHGLDKKVAEKFSDDHEIVDIQLNYRGKKKRLRAFKDNESMLIPCKQKNCTHTDLDFNNVSICTKFKHTTESPSPPLLPCEKDHKPQQYECTEEPCWDVDISDGGVIISEAQANQPVPQPQPRTDETAPQIVNIRSLAPNFATSRLNPLATQLPNPSKRFKIPSRSNPLRLPPPMQAFQICSSTPSRPGILSRSSSATSSVPRGQFFVLPQSRRVPVASSSYSSAQLLNAVTPRFPVQLAAASPQKVVPGPSRYITSQPVASTSMVPKIDQVVTLMPELTAKPDESKEDDDEPMVIDESEPVKPEEPMPSTEPTDKPEAQEEESDDETEGTPTPVPSFNIAKNIFETQVDSDEGDDLDTATSSTPVDDFVPQIVSIVGGAEMFTPETILTVAGQPGDVVNSDSPIMARAKDAKLKQIRAKLALDQFKSSVEFPVQKIINGMAYVVCPVCKRGFSTDTVQNYRIHLLRDHKIIIKPLPDSKTSPTATGRVGIVEGVPAQYRKIEAKPSPVPKPELKANDWYRCKACDELLKKKEIPEHRASCCPNQRTDFAFVPVKISDGANHSATVPLTCGLCEKSCDSIVGLRQHLTSYHREIACKVLLEPALRCGSCLSKFEDSIHLTLHCSACTTRKASAETMLELAQGMLYCEICQTTHESVNETQDCYTNTQMIRCIICLNVVLSRGNFFHHMKTYHYRSTVGISCPFCELGEIPIRDCFVHIIDNHYNPILKLYKQRGQAGIGFDANNRITIATEPSTVTTTSPTRMNLAASSAPAAATATTASRLVLPNLAGGQGFTRVALAGSSGTTRPQYLTVRAINSRGLTVVNPSQFRNVRLTGPTASAAGRTGAIIRQVQTSAGVHYIGANGQVLRPIRPMTTGQTTMMTSISGSNLIRQLRPIRPAMTASVAGTSGGSSVIQPSGTIRPITAAQLQERLRLPMLHGNQRLVTGTLINLGNSANLNLQ